MYTLQVTKTEEQHITQAHAHRTHKGRYLEVFCILWKYLFQVLLVKEEVGLGGLGEAPPEDLDGLHIRHLQDVPDEAEELLAQSGRARVQTQVAHQPGQEGLRQGPEGVGGGHSEQG
eukprot:10247644-Lingulodinium_polyedra.AAC.1